MMKKKIILNEKGKQLIKRVTYVAVIYEDETDGLTKIKKWDSDYVVLPGDVSNFSFKLRGDDLDGEVYQA